MNRKKINNDNKYLEKSDLYNLYKFYSDKAILSSNIALKNEYLGRARMAKYLLDEFKFPKILSSDCCGTCRFSADNYKNLCCLKGISTDIMYKCNKFKKR